MTLLCVAFDEVELLKLWKGLYVSMWHSDKPLVQVLRDMCVNSVCTCWEKSL